MRLYWAVCRPKTRFQTSSMIINQKTGSVQNPRWNLRVRAVDGRSIWRLGSLGFLLFSVEIHTDCHNEHANFDEYDCTSFSIQYQRISLETCFWSVCHHFKQKFLSKVINYEEEERISFAVAAFTVISFTVTTGQHDSRN